MSPLTFPVYFTLNLLNIKLINFNRKTTIMVFKIVSTKMLPMILPAYTTLYLKKNKIKYKRKCIDTVDIAVTVE